MRLDKDIAVWQAALNTAEEQHGACRVRLDALDTERAELVEEMQRLERVMESVRPLTASHPLDEINRFLHEFTPDPESSLADACRSILVIADRYMTPMEIRDVLEASNYDLNQHPNPLASIHGILKRFEESGEVSNVSLGNKASYRIAPPRREYIRNVVEGVPPADASVSGKKLPEWYKKLGEAGGITIPHPSHVNRNEQKPKPNPKKKGGAKRKFIVRGRKLVPSGDKETS